jgi:hypothetical protein
MLKKKILVWLGMSECRGISNNLWRTADSTQQRLQQLNLMNSVRRATNSGSAVAMEIFVAISKQYYYCEALTEMSTGSISWR